MATDSINALQLEEFSVKAGDFRSPPISLTARRGTLSAFVGRRGSGKSIIFERLASVHRPGVEQSGNFSAPRVALVPQDARLSVLPTDRVWSLTDLSVWGTRAQRIFGRRFALSDREQKSRKLLTALLLDPERIASLPFRDLSSSERRRVLLCSALLSKPDTLLIDGWDEAMDAHDREAIGQVLKQKLEDGLILLVSSRRSPLEGLPPATHIELGDSEPTGEVPVPLISRNAPVDGHDFPLLEVNRLRVNRGRFRFRGSPQAHPVDGASLYVRHNESVVLLGPSGSGKTTFLETIAGLQSPSSGAVLFSGHDVTHARGSRARRLRRDVQLVFQDATSVLDGSRTVSSHLQEALSLARGDKEKPTRWLEKLGLSPRLATSTADQLSSSESQRVDLGRSLALTPQLVLFDAPEVSGADADGGLLSSLLAAAKARGCAFLIATSHPEIASSLGDRIAILHAGRIVEFGSRLEILERPAHPASKSIINGSELPLHDPTAPRTGCAFASCCSRRKLPLCDEKEPMLAPLTTLTGPQAGQRVGSRRVACFHPLET